MVFFFFFSVINVINLATFNKNLASSWQILITLLCQSLEISLSIHSGLRNVKNAFSIEETG